MPSGFDPRELEGALQGIEDDIAEIAKHLTIVATLNLREYTPKDTWHASANWIPSIGTPHAGIVEGVSYAAQEAALADIRARYTVDAGSIYITNNVPYIQFLIDGSSDQASSGWEQRAIDEAIDEVFGSRGLL